MTKRDMRIEIETLKDQNHNLVRTLDSREDLIATLTPKPPKPPKPAPITWVVTDLRGLDFEIVADECTLWGAGVDFARDGKLVARFTGYTKLTRKEEQE